MPDLEEQSRLFHEGLALFNQGEGFDAHEVWEDLWNLAEGPDKKFYQGLIQLAVTIEHIRRGNPRGALKVFESAKTKFVGLPKVYRGIDHVELCAAMAAWLPPPTEPPEVTPPTKAIDRGQVNFQGKELTLPVKLEDAPRITLLSEPFPD